MAWMFMHGSCYTCHAMISFNPDRVPSVRIEGVRQPICAECHARWNKIHQTSQGLEPIPHHPDAYEPVEVI